MRLRQRKLEAPQIMSQQLSSQATIIEPPAKKRKEKWKMNCCSVDWQNNMKTHGIHTDQSDSRFNLDEICFKLAFRSKKSSQTLQINIYHE